jgi:hypothetical protein
MSFLAITVLASTLYCPSTPSPVCDLAWKLPAELPDTVSEEYTLTITTESNPFDALTNYVFDGTQLEQWQTGAVNELGGSLTNEAEIFSFLRTETFDDAPAVIDWAGSKATLDIVDVVETPEPQWGVIMLAFLLLIYHRRSGVNNG